MHGHNPCTNESVTVKAKQIPKFTADKAFSSFNLKQKLLLNNDNNNDNNNS